MLTPPVVVVDASLLVALVYEHRYAEEVSAQLRRWIDGGTELHAPELLRYEVANSLTRLVVAGELAREDLPAAWAHLAAQPVVHHPLVEGHRAAEIALALDRSRVYDAAYLLLSGSLEAPLYTLDGKLARNAKGNGFDVELLAAG